MLCFSSLERSGSDTLPALTSIADYRFPGTATLDGTFTSDLTDPNSVGFQRIEREFCFGQCENNSKYTLSNVENYGVSQGWSHAARVEAH